MVGAYVILCCAHTAHLTSVRTCATVAQVVPYYQIGAPMQSTDRIDIGDRVIVNGDGRDQEATVTHVRYAPNGGGPVTVRLRTAWGGTGRVPVERIHEILPPLSDD